jgi:hypothetical protein
MKRLLLLLLLPSTLLGQDLVLARAKYGGGGDWYNDPSAIPNLARELTRRTSLVVSTEETIVDLGSEGLFNHPFIFLTGHGNIKLSDREVRNLRTYLTAGGFLYADDDYGMDEAFRREMERIFPGEELIELEFNHPIYHILYDFPKGLPKIHEHDGQPPQGFGILHEGRLVVFYTYETNIADGWADPQVHGDPPEKRDEAFRMGINIVLYALTH